LRSPRTYLRRGQRVFKASYVKEDPLTLIFVVDWLLRIQLVEYIPFEEFLVGAISFPLVSILCSILDVDVKSSTKLENRSFCGVNCTTLKEIVAR
jgi:hypothetical protein